MRPGAGVGGWQDIMPVTGGPRNQKRPGQWSQSVFRTELEWISGKPPEAGKRSLTSELRVVGPCWGPWGPLDEVSANWALGLGGSLADSAEASSPWPETRHVGVACLLRGHLTPCGWPGPLASGAGGSGEPTGTRIHFPLAVMTLFPDLYDFLVITFSPQLCPFSLIPQEKNKKNIGFQRLSYAMGWIMSP